MKKRTPQLMQDSRLSRRSVLGAMGGLGLAGLMSGCSGGGSGSAGGSTKELTVTFWGEGNQNKLQLKLIELYEKQAGGVSIKPEYSGLAGYYDKLATRLAGGNAPDIFGIHSAALADYAERGAVLNLQKYFSDPLGLDEVVEESVVEGCRIGGKLHFVPLGVSTEPGFVYDKAALDEAGASEPTNDWTWADFEEIAGAVSDAGKLTAGTADFGGEAIALGAYLRTNGLSLFASGGLGFDQDDLAEWLELWHRLRREKLAVPIDVTAGAVGFENNPVVTGDAALTTVAKDKGWLALDGLTKNELELVPFPRADADAPAATQMVPGAWFAISAKSEAVDAAIDFLAFHISDLDAAGKIGIGRHGVPLFERMRKKLYPEENEASKKIYDVLTAVRKQETAAVDAVYPVGAAELLLELVEINQKIGFGDTSVKKGAASFFESAERLLKK